MSQGDLPGEEFRLRSERIGSLLEQRQTFELTDAVVTRGSIRTHHDGLGRGRVDDPLEATLAAVCAMLDVRLAALEERVGRLE